MIVCQALTGTGGKGGLPGGEGGKEPGEEQGSARGEAPKSNASFDMGHVLNSKSAIQKDMAKAMKKNGGYWSAGSQLLHEIATAGQFYEMSAEVDLLKVRVGVMEAILPLDYLEQEATRCVEDPKLSDAQKEVTGSWATSFKERVDKHRKRVNAPDYRGDENQAYLTTLLFERSRAGSSLASAAEFDGIDAFNGLAHKLDGFMSAVTSDQELRVAKFQFQPRLDTFERHGEWTKQTTKNVRSEKQSRERAAKGDVNKTAARVQATATSETIPPAASGGGPALPAGPYGILNLDLSQQPAVAQFAVAEAVTSDEEPYIIVDSAGVKSLSVNRAVKVKVVLSTAAGS